MQIINVKWFIRKLKCGFVKKKKKVKINERKKKGRAGGTSEIDRN